VLLAGGRSSRMGRDKALLDWHGRPLIEHQIATLYAAGVDAVRVSGPYPNHGGITDNHLNCGPLEGIATVVDSLPGDADLLVIPVDMPRLDAALLRRLWPVTGAGCVRLFDHVLPMRLRLDAISRCVLDKLLARSKPATRSLRALQTHVGLYEIPLRAGDAIRLQDCNTPGEWQEAYA